MPTIINADTATGGAIITGDTSGQLQLQSGGVTALTTTGANVAVAGALTMGTALSPANGGTGVTTPGASGNVLVSNGTAWTSAAPVSGVQQFTSSGSITAGQAVALNSDGTVSTVTGTSTSQAVVATNAVGYSNNVGPRFANTFYDAEIDRTIMVMATIDGGYYIYASSYRVASNGSVTNGSGVYLGTYQDNGSIVACTIVKTGTARYAAVYRSDSGTAIIRALTINTSTGAVSNPWGGSVSVANGNAPVDATYDATSNRLLVAFRPNSSRVELRAYDPATGSQTASLQVTITDSYYYTVAIASNTAVPGEFLVLFGDPNTDSQMSKFVGTINSAGTVFTAGAQAYSIGGSGVGSSVLSLNYVSSINRYIAINSSSSGSYNPYVSILNTSGGAVTGSQFSFPDSRQVYRFNSGNIDVTNSEIRVVGSNGASGSSLQYARMAFTASTLGTPTYSPSFPSSGAYNQAGAIYTPTAYSTFLTAPARNSSTTNFEVVAFTIQSFSSNAQNFTGFATNTVTTGQNAIVAVPGGVATNLTSLTRNTEYYLNFDGSLVTTATPFGVVLRATSTTGGEVIRPVSARRPIALVSISSVSNAQIPLGAKGFRSIELYYSLSLTSSSFVNISFTTTSGSTVTPTTTGLYSTSSTAILNSSWSQLGAGTSTSFTGLYSVDSSVAGGVAQGNYGGLHFSGNIASMGSPATQINLTCPVTITSGTIMVYGIPA
jgi:hypothetical protein